MGQSEAKNQAFVEDILRNLPDEGMTPEELVESLLSILDLLGVKYDGEEMKQSLKEKLGNVEKKIFEKKDLSALVKDYI